MFLYIINHIAQNVQTKPSITLWDKLKWFFSVFICLRSLPFSPNMLTCLKNSTHNKSAVLTYWVPLGMLPCNKFSFVHYFCSWTLELIWRNIPLGISVLWGSAKLKQKPKSPLCKLCTTQNNAIQWKDIWQINLVCPKSSITSSLSQLLLMFLALSSATFHSWRPFPTFKTVLFLSLLYRK